MARGVARITKRGEVVLATIRVLTARCAGCTFRSQSDPASGSPTGGCEAGSFVAGPVSGPFPNWDRGGSELSAAVLRFGFMSDEEPELTADVSADAPTADETTAGLEILQGLIDGTATAESGELCAHNTVNYNG